MIHFGVWTPSNSSLLHEIDANINILISADSAVSFMTPFFFFYIRCIFTFSKLHKEKYNYMQIALISPLPLIAPSLTLAYSTLCCCYIILINWCNFNVCLLVVVFFYPHNVRLSRRVSLEKWFTPWVESMKLVQIFKLSLFCRSLNWNTDGGLWALTKSKNTLKASVELQVLSLSLLFKQTSSGCAIGPRPAWRQQIRRL